MAVSVATTATVPGRNACLKNELKLGDRVEFRVYWYNQRYATGKVIGIGEKSAVVRVDKAMRSARVEFEDITMVIR